MHGCVVDALRMREEDNTSKSHKKRLRCASKTLKERVDERGDGTFITKERALQMVHKHEIYDLKRKTAIEAVNKFRNLKTENEQKNNPVEKCTLCYCGYASKNELNSHICVAFSEIDKLAGIARGDEDGTEGGAAQGGVDASELIAMDEQVFKIEKLDRIKKKEKQKRNKFDAMRKSMWKTGQSFFKKSTEEAVHDDKKLQQEEVERKIAWEKAKLEAGTFEKMYFSSFEISYILVINYRKNIFFISFFNSSLLNVFSVIIAFKNLTQISVY